MRKIKPLHLFLGFVALSFLIAFLVGGFVLGQNQLKKDESQTPPITLEPSPTPTCTPRPKCLDETPRCLFPESLDMCPPSAIPTQTEKTDRKIFCTKDAKQCPDGTWVGRTGPNCEFTCPK